MNTMVTDDLLAQLETAILAVKEQTDEGSPMHLAHFSKHNSKVLDAWKQISLGNVSSANWSTADAVHFLLMVESVSFVAAQMCVEYIHSGHINGRAALYCISEIRLFLNRTTREVSSVRDTDRMVDSLQQLGAACVAPVVEGDIDAASANSFSSCLELLPTIADGLHHLHRLGTIADLFDSIFFVNWNLAALLPLSSILCELYSYLSQSNLASFKKKLLASAVQLQAQSEDFAGVIRVALRLFEQSNDIRWTDVLRVLYRAIPESSIATVEALLEQIFTQSVRVAKLLLCALEDTAVSQGHAVVVNTHVEMPNVEFRRAGVPEISHFDVRLALILTRAIYVSSCSTNNTGGTVSLNNISEIALPLVLTSGLVEGDASSDNMLFEAQLCSRCVFMLLTTCVSLKLSQDLRYSMYTGDSAVTAVSATIRQVILSLSDLDSGATASSGGWLSDARAQELLKSFLQLGAYPEIPAACLAAVQSWFEERQPPSTDISTDNEPTVAPVVELILESSEKLLARMILDVFCVRSKVRSALLQCVLKGIFCCASSGTLADAHRKGAGWPAVPKPSSSSQSSTPQTLSTSQSIVEHGVSTAIADSLLPIHTLLQDVFAQLCVRHSKSLLEHSSIIETQFPTLIQAPIPQVTDSFLRSVTAVCTHSTPIFALVHTHLLKNVQGADAHKAIAAVRLLIPLLFIVNEAQQKEVLNIVAHVFTRTAVFSREACVLLIAQLRELQNGPLCFVEKAPAPFLMRLQELVNSKLSTCFSDVVVEKGTSAKTETVFVPSLCVTPSTGVEQSIQITEDVHHYLLLSWELEMLLNPNEAQRQMAVLAENMVNPDSSASGNISITDPSVAQHMWGIILHAIHGLQSSVTSCRTAPDTTRQSIGSPSAIVPATAAAAPSSSSRQSPRVQPTSLVPTSAVRPPRSSAMDAQSWSGTEVCELLVSHSALGAVLKCLVASSLTVNMQAELTKTDHKEESCKVSELLQEAVLAVAAILDVLHELIAKVTSTITVPQCLQYHMQHQQGMSSFALPLAKGSNVTEYAVTPSVPLHVGAVQTLLASATRLLSDESLEETYPLSCKLGMLNHLVHFVCDASRPQATAAAVPSAFNDASEERDQQDRDCLFQSLLTVYTSVCAVSLEVDHLNEEHALYRQYQKQVRKWTGRQTSSDLRHSPRPKKYVRYDDTRDTDEADGCIYSDPEDDTFSETEDNGRQRRGGSGLQGFKLSTLLPARALRTAHQQIDRDDLSASCAGITNYRVIVKVGKKHQVRVDLIVAFSNEWPEATALPLWQQCLVSAAPKVRATFQRWDVHFAEREVKVNASTSDAAYASEENPEDTSYSVLENRPSVKSDVQTALFNVRSELLIAITARVAAERFPDANVVLCGSGPFAGKATSGTQERCAQSQFQVARYFAGEVVRSMKHGIMVRTFNAYIGLLAAVHRSIGSAVFEAHHMKTPTAHGNVVDCETTSGRLWQTLQNLASALPYMVSPIVHAALQYRETCGGLDDCAAVLTSIGQERFAAEKTASTVTSDASSGSEAESDTQAVCRRHRNARGDEGTFDGTGKATPENSIVVTKAVADLVAKEVIKHLAGVLSMVLKQPEWLTSVKVIICPECPDPQQYVYLCAARGCKALFALFAEADDDRASTTSTASNNRAPSSKKRSSSKDKMHSGPEPEKKHMLIDSLSDARISQVLDVITKLLAQCTKECVGLLKSALLIRRILNFVARTHRLSQAATRVFNTFDGSEEEEDYLDEFPNRRGADTTEQLLDPVDLHLERLHSGKYAPPAPPSALFGLLSDVPTVLVANLETWLVQQIMASHTHPTKAQVAIIKRTQKAYTALDSLCSQLFAIVKETDKQYPQELEEVEDDRLRELWNGVQNPVVSQPLVLVSTEGRRLLGSLGISAGAEDSAADGAAEGADDDIVETHRKKTHYRGGESIRLQRVAGVSRTSALSTHRLASMAAAARTGGKKSSSRQSLPRSRHSVINTWLALDGATGDDNFADMEDFIVE